VATLRIEVRTHSAPQLRQAYTVSSISAETERPRYVIRPAQTGHGIIREGKLEAGTAT